MNSRAIPIGGPHAPDVAPTGIFRCAGAQYVPLFRAWPDPAHLYLTGIVTFAGIPAGARTATFRGRQNFCEESWLALQSYHDF